MKTLPFSGVFDSPNFVGVSAWESIGNHAKAKHRVLTRAGSTPACGAPRGGPAPAPGAHRHRGAHMPSRRDQDRRAAGAASSGRGNAGDRPTLGCSPPKPAPRTTSTIRSISASRSRSPTVPSSGSMPCATASSRAVWKTSKAFAHVAALGPMPGATLPESGKPTEKRHGGNHA